MSREDDVIARRCARAAAPRPTLPPAALEQELGSLAPVSPRRPLRQLAIVAGIERAWLFGTHNHRRRAS